jgi:L-fucose mutarotase
MLKTTLLHPEILRVCARAGHHSKILIADGNYPAATKRGAQSELICLQLTPGVPTVAQVLRALLSAVPVDTLNTMGIPPEDPYAKFGEPPAWSEYRALAKEVGVAAIEPIGKWEFYQAVESSDHVLTIQTADQALWANVLVTIGCRVPGP